MLAIALGAIEFLVTILRKQTAIIQTRECVSCGVQLQLLELLVFHQDRHAEKAHRGQHVHHRRFQRYAVPHALGKLGTARENLAPVIETLRRRQLDARDGFEELLKKRTSNGLLDIVESFDKEVEERVVGPCSMRLRWLGHQSFSFARLGLTHPILLSDSCGDTGEHSNDDANAQGIFWAAKVCMFLNLKETAGKTWITTLQAQR